MMCYVIERTKNNTKSFYRQHFWAPRFDIVAHIHDLISMRLVEEVRYYMAFGMIKSSTIASASKANHVFPWELRQDDHVKSIHQLFWK